MQSNKKCAEILRSKAMDPFWTRIGALRQEAIDTLRDTGDPAYLKAWDAFDLVYSAPEWLDKNNVDKKSG